MGYRCLSGSSNLMEISKRIYHENTTICIGDCYGFSPDISAPWGPGESRSENQEREPQGDQPEH
jgi:hypothetical protein